MSKQSQEEPEKMDRSEKEWADMLFNDRIHLLDREKKIHRLQELKRLQMLKRGLRQYE